MGQSLGCIKVNQSTMAVTEHFGRFDKVLGPGCHCLPGCFGFELAGKLSLRDELISVHCETNTKDNCFVKVVTYIRYRVVPENASDAFYKLSNPRLVMQAYVFYVIRATVPRLELDAVFLQKKGIAKAVEDELTKNMSAYGYEIVQTLIVDIAPDVQVKKAMNNINAAARMRESVPGATEKDVMDMVLMTQYFDTMKDIGASSKSSALFIPHGPGAVKDVASQIREGCLQAESVPRP